MPLRILHVIPSISARRGGPSFAVIDMAKGLAELGAQVHIATTDDDGPGRLSVPLKTPIVDNGVTLTYFPRQTKFYGISLPLTKWLYNSASRFDVLHIHALFSYASVQAGFVAAQRQVPYIVRPLGTLDRWGMEHRRPLLKRVSFALLEGRILDRAAAVHFTTRREKRQADQLSTTMRSVLIPLGMHLTPFEIAKPSGWLRGSVPQLASRTTVLFLSRLHPVKGLELLFLAFRDARRACPDLALIIAGDGPPAYVAKLKREAIRLGIASDIVWLGFVDVHDKVAALADADIFVLPSHSESLGRAALEAMAAGAAVIVSDQVGVSDEVNASEAGLVAACDVPSLANALVRLAREPQTRARLGERGRALAKSAFSIESVARQLMVLYEKILLNPQRSQ
jgi:glycosyltransferase involved in cell wall biosynthesis